MWCKLRLCEPNIHNAQRVTLSLNRASQSNETCNRMDPLILSLGGLRSSHSVGFDPLTRWASILSLGGLRSSHSVGFGSSHSVGFGSSHSVGFDPLTRWACRWWVLWRECSHRVAESVALCIARVNSCHLALCALRILSISLA